MTLFVVLIVVIPLSAFGGFFVVAPMVTGHPPLTMPGTAVYVESYRNDLKRRWPPYTRAEREATMRARKSYLGPFA